MSKGSILVIDDESEIREGLELLLKTEGYQVASAETALSGLTRLEERPFDLMLLDVSLPDRNGIELLKDRSRLGRRNLAGLSGVGVGLGSVGFRFRGRSWRFRLRSSRLRPQRQG